MGSKKAHYISLTNRFHFAARQFGDDVNPLHLNISIYILHTRLLAFLLVWIRRICSTIEAS